MSLLPPDYLDAVVAIGFGNGKGSVDWVATGFFYASEWPSKITKAPAPEGTFLVTNRHVIDAMGDPVYARVNTEIGQPPRDVQFWVADRDGDDLWVAHADPRVDVAVCLANPYLFEAANLDLLRFMDDNRLTVEGMNEHLVSEGDEVYLLGFPSGLISDDVHCTVVRHGIIARSRDLLGGFSSEFLIDAQNHGGNSGGPVILQPEFDVPDALPRRETAYLVGVLASGYLFYGENAALGVVYPVDAIDETIAEYWRVRRPSGNGGRPE